MRATPSISREREFELLNSFGGYKYHRTDLSEVIEADVSKQNFVYGPRGYYITTLHVCRKCGTEFRFTAEEQQVWFEEYGLSVCAFPDWCLTCRREIRQEKAKRKLYDEYLTDDDANLTAQQCRELADLIMNLFGPELNEKRRNRYNRMMNRISNDDDNRAS